jgi:hypothetical protein
MSTVFNQRFKHGRLDFHPGVPYGFEDPDAAPYFEALGVAAPDEAEPAVTIGIGEIDIDPCTLWGTGPNKWRFVMPDRAADARGTSLEDAQAFVWDGVEVLFHG